MNGERRGKSLELTEEAVRGPWFPGAEGERFLSQLDACCRRRGSAPGIELVVEETATKFLARLFAAVLTGRTVALGSVGWGTEERRQARTLMERLGEEEPERGGEILIPTGGSGGRLRFARHTWESLACSAMGFGRFFGGDPVRSICVLPLFHVSGLMQVVRAVVTGGEFVRVDWETLLAGNVAAAEGRFLSLVPTQLRRLLDVERVHPWLRTLRAIPVGGASAPTNVVEAAARLRLPVVLSYGATESAAMISAQKPEEFLGGDRTSGRVLPHVELAILGADGETLGAGVIGRVGVKGSSLFSGYIPGERRAGAEWITGDLGFVDVEGRLVVTGREDRTVITGGENVSPEEVERVLLGSGLVEDVRVFGVEDDEWGQVLTAAYVTRETVEPERLRAWIRGKLAKFKVPKHWIAIDEIPRNERGKVDQRRLEARVRGDGASRFSS